MSYARAEGYPWHVVASGLFGGYSDVEAMGIDGVVQACIVLDDIKRRTPRGDR